MAKDDRRLGKGLGALLGESLEGEGGVVTERSVSLDRIRPNPFQPRTGFSDASLEELATSIAENGLLQPIVVRDVGDSFQIVAGERRFRALQRLGWETAPVVTRVLSDDQMLVVALVENLQRENLSPLEEAQGYERLIADFGMTQEGVGRSVGRERSTVSNALRLLTLPLAVQELLAAGRISAGHARAVLGLSKPGDQVSIAARAADGGWSVRETERRVRVAREARGTSRVGAATPTPRAMDPAVRRAELILQRVLGTHVKVRPDAGGGGDIVVPFQDGDDFVRLLDLIAGNDATDHLR